MSASTSEVLVAELLHEGVVASRGAGGPFGGEASCGLGDGPELGAALTDKGRALIDQIWPGGLTGEDAERLRRALDEWIRRQDAHDRRRNHFMKDFRGRHGYDRSAYDEKTLAAWEAGLTAIYEEVAADRADAARDLSRMLSVP